MRCDPDLARGGPLRGTGRGAGIAVLLAALALVGCQRSGLEDEPPSGLLLITIDTLRADHLGCHGAPGDPTPNIDRLAAEGVRFPNATTPVPVTLPAHASLMTSVSPPVHGVRDNGSFRLGPALPTLAQRMRDAGWSSAAFVGAVVLDAGYGLDRGFEHYDDTIRVSADREQDGLSAYPDRPAGEVVDAALAWLRERPRGSRFFAWVHLFDPHFPYAPPEPARTEFGATYEAEVRYTDQEIGRLLEGLASMGHAEDTVVVLTSDHGEGLGEHGETTHGYFLYQSTLHVPLIVRGPGRLPAGRRVPGRVSLLDVAPTLLELAGLEPLPDGEGLSLLDAARGGAVPERPFYLETYLPYFEMQWSGSSGLLEGDWKYLHSAEPELYDLAADPGEERDLASSRPEVTERMEAGLRSLARSLNAAATDDAAAPRLDEEREARLRSLGYLPGGAGRPDDLAARAALRPDTRSRIQLLDTLVRVAPAAIDQGDPEALEQLAELSRRNPDNPRLITLLGKALLGQGRVADAVPVLRRAVELDPENPRLHGNLAAALLRVGASEEAAVVIDRALVLDSDDPAVRRLYGNLLLTREAGRAEAIFRELLAGNPEDLAAMRGLAKSLAAQDRWAEALETADRVLVSEPDGVEDLVLAGAAALRLQRPAAAEERLRRALRHDPNHLTALLNLGLALGARDDHGEATRVLERAVSIAPDHPLVLRAYAEAAARAGDVAAARRALEHSLSVNPDQPSVRELLRRLER